MGSWSVSEESIQALTNMGDRLTELADQIANETQQLRTVFEENQDGLGAHSADILALIEEVEAAQQDASIPVKKLVLKLYKAAVIRKKHLETKRYGRSR